MEYHAPTKKFLVTVDDLEFVSLSLLESIKKIREVADLPLDPYERNSQLTASDHAQKMIIEAAERLGINLGAKWGNELDLRNN